LDDESDPVERTRRQLDCYYRCVVRGEWEKDDLCPECGKCPDHCYCDDEDEEELDA
jgi:hypothetical protein